MLTRPGTQKTMMVGLVGVSALALAGGQLRPELMPWLPLGWALMNQVLYILVFSGAVSEATANVAPQWRGAAGGVFLGGLNFAPGIGAALAAYGLQHQSPGGDNYGYAFALALGAAILGLVISLAAPRDVAKRRAT